MGGSIGEPSGDLRRDRGGPAEHAQSAAPTRPWAIVVACVLAATAFACGPPLAFSCAEDEQCRRGDELGVCQPTGYCSFGDPSCASSQRYGRFAGPGLEAQCVPSEPIEPPPEGGSEGGDAGSDPVPGDESSGGSTGAEGFGSSDGAETSDAGTSDAVAACGNGVREGDEDCDGADLSLAYCGAIDLGYGMLTCTPACTFDVSDCDWCGNDQAGIGEACDGTDLRNLQCATLPGYGYTGGRLACTGECELDTSGCTP